MSHFVPGRSILFMGITLAIIRIAMGLFWLSNLSWKMPPSFGCDSGEGLCYRMERMADYSIFPPQAWFVENIALPYHEVFGYLVAGVELLAGTLLALGLLTRFAALLGTIQAVNLYIGLSSAPDEWMWSYLMLLFLHLIILATAAGRYFGIDTFLHDRWRARYRTHFDEGRALRLGVLST